MDIVLCGIGGYGTYYLRCLGEKSGELGCQVAGIVDPFAPEILPPPFSGIPVFQTLNDYFSQGRTCDLVVISSPIPFHCEQTCLALERGADVLCEKPLCSTKEEIRRMQESEKNSGKRVFVGYQWSYTEGVQKMRADVLAGVYGTPRTLKAFVCWPRTENYYTRNSWAGRIHDNEGRPIFDSPAHNAMAHFLQHLLYISGSERGAGTWPESLEARLFRVNDIENFDTIAMIGRTRDGTQLGFFASHATREVSEARLLLEFDRGYISCGENASRGVPQNGKAIRYDAPFTNSCEEKLIHAVQYIRHGSAISCGIAESEAQVHCVNLLQDFAGKIIEAPSRLIRRTVIDGGILRYVHELKPALEESYEKMSLLPVDKLFR